jgi:mono/diheme cytochrome c family protein
MKKVLKVLLIVVAVIIVLVGIGALYISVSGIPTYEVKKIDFTAQADSTQIARGKKLASLLCAHCHMNEETGTLAGQHMNDAPEFGILYSQNITHDDEFGIGTWTDGEILYLLRTGILRDGRYAPPYMAKLPYMADEDIEAVIAFIRSDDPLVVATHVPDKPCEPSFLTKFLTRVAFKPLPYPEAPIAMPDTTNPVEWGKYLALNLDCWTCHSPAFEKLNIAEPDKTPGYFSGGNPSLRTREGQSIVSLNITPDVETGIGSWTEEQFIKAVRFGIIDGQEAVRWPMMPYSQLTNHEAAAIYAYLKTVPPVKNKVERTVLE